MDIKLPSITCKRCGHNWVPRKPTIRVCPKCLSPYFDKERRKDGKTASNLSYGKRV